MPTYQDLRNHLLWLRDVMPTYQELRTVRCYLLWLRNELHMRFGRCDGCHNRGIVSVSLFYPAELCQACHDARLFRSRPSKVMHLPVPHTGYGHYERAQ